MEQFAIDTVNATLKKMTGNAPSLNNGDAVKSYAISIRLVKDAT